MHRLLKGDEREAEKAMLYVLETRAVEDRRDRFTPYEARDLLVAARAPEASFRALAAKLAPDDAADARCSDFYFFYAEWLDMRSRAAVAKRRREAAAAVEWETAALGKDVPPTLLGEPISAALTDIERRIARFPAGETR